MNPLKNKDLRWLGMDFDKTIAHNTGHPNFTPTTPIDDVKEVLDELTRRGWKITVETARSWADYKIVEDFMEKHDLPFRRIICGKPLFHFRFDDRAKQFVSWKALLDDPELKL